MKVALLCGGPSLERGISLNSARSVLDHLSSDDIEIVPIYLDFKKKPYKISPAQLYSNTPSDFDFKLHQTAQPLTEKKFVDLLRTVAIAFPVMHGPYGEDGGVQRFFEKHDIPFVGSSSKTCKYAFDKFKANYYLKKHGFFTLPSVVLKIYHNDHRQIIQTFFNKHKIRRAVVKPASGGSSIGVFSVSSPQEALEKAQLLFSKRMDTRVVIEPFAQGIEFTAIILENRFGLPVTLPPTEIETDYTENQIFDFRKKYLPTRQVIWHCPPRFDASTIEKIQTQAEQLFALFGMRDFSRFDGWMLPNGNIWFCDFNPVSGMEQNSFLFQQASRVGMTHSEVLRHILQNACRRYGIKFPKESLSQHKKRKPVHIIFGGDNSERQVSLMSGTNVWLKLRRSQRYEPHPYLLDTKGGVWQLPYHLALNHTVEEIIENCKNYYLSMKQFNDFEQRARFRLGFLGSKPHAEFFEPKKLTMSEFIKDSEFIFIALHGGDGENGNIQKLLTEKGVKFNGPGEDVSRLCIDKWATSQFIKNLKIEGVGSIPCQLVKTVELTKFGDNKIRGFWRKACKELSARTLIVKPRADGCSSGVVHLYSSNDLKRYLDFLASAAPFIPKNSFRKQLDHIEMPTIMSEDLIFEKYIETDVLRVRGNKLKYYPRSGWIETTIGIIEKDKKIKALNPSITIAEGEVLTVEEKFQGGTGINITPPPQEVIKSSTIAKIKNRVEAVARAVGIKGYSRIDIFVHVDTGNILVIEINTLPALTPSTVFYQQALAEKPSLFPRDLLEYIIKNTAY
ncbi:hypothetical protein MYX07_03250 [Patescibacteria group bacterium AH-259-L07]|nr:hypothetical protein [Patescibacteria group bacterium AH-259-L07]